MRPKSIVMLTKNTWTVEIRGMGNRADGRMCIESGGKKEVDPSRKGPRHA